jgi:ADP-heptose:LPS heptosyltransferase
MRDCPRECIAPVRFALFGDEPPLGVWNEGRFDPDSVPYLRADSSLVARWAERMSAGKELKVGLAWAGRASHKNDRNRSLESRKLGPLAQVKGTKFFSLQKEKRAGYAAAPDFEIVDFAEGLTDFADTAAVMAKLDLVITVDTSAAHLAGALGKRVWILLPFYAEWRWQDRRADSPWYPTMRLFRQSAVGAWESVIGSVRDQLAIEVRKHEQQSFCL